MRAALASSTLVAGVLVPRLALGASACAAERPTSESAAWSYAGSRVASYDTSGGRFRVHYVVEGPHAPNADGASTPPLVITAGAAAEAALERYVELGFRPPVSDAPAVACADDGGDARVDIYLFDFGSADGTIEIAECGDGAVPACSGFALVENDFAGKGYTSAELGARTVVPHELFHLLEYAYSPPEAVWWSEATAQWAADAVDPELGDLERFLPAFFANTDRPIDFPAVGAAASFSYGLAIWPVFLSQRFGKDTVRRIFEHLGDGAPDVLEATERALGEVESSLAEAFADFALWNAATGSRAGEAGYVHAASYPEVSLESLEDADGAVLAGLSARYFEVTTDDPIRLSLEGAGNRVRARFVPLDDGARLEDALELPADVAGPGVVVVAGQARDRRDVLFSVRVDPAFQAAIQDADGCRFAPLARPSFGPCCALLGAGLVYAVRRRIIRAASSHGAKA